MKQNMLYSLERQFMVTERDKGPYFMEKNSRHGNSNPGRNYYNYKRKKQQRKERRNRAIAATVVVALIVIGVVFAVRKKISASGKAAASAGGTVEEGGLSSGTALKIPVSVNDVNIDGMSRESAKKAILEKYAWGMTAKLQNAQGTSQSTQGTSGSAASSSGSSADSGSKDPNVYQISNLLSLKVDKVLKEIYDGNTSGKTSYTLDSSGMDTEIAAEVAAMSKKWDKEAKNGAVSGFDKDTNSFTYSDSTDGITIDQNSLTADIKTAMDDQNYKAEIAVKASVKAAELSKDAARQKYKVIGTFTTKATTNADRNNNLKLACAAIDGRILQKGEEFSFNESTGNRTTEKGYKPAGAYQNGIVVQEPGGGVCQVSSTLYNAVIESGMQTTERHAHTFAPTYVTPGEDATVSYDGYAGPDMKFINTTESAIAIRASFQNLTVTVSVIGIPILADGETVTMHSEKTNDYDNASTEYVEDPAMVPGEEKLVDEGTMGSRWVTNLVRKKDGKVVSDAFYHDSTYKGHSKKIARNTSGVQQTGESVEELTITENTDTVAGQGTDQAGSAPTKAADHSSAASSTVDSGPGSDKTTAASKKETSKASSTVSPTAASSAAGSSSSAAAETVETVPPAP